MLDDRGVFVQLSLKIEDLAEARAKRDILERADDEFWSSLMLGENADTVTMRYATARKRVEALYFTYRHPQDISTEPLDMILCRIETVMTTQTQKPIITAVLGEVLKPITRVTGAFDLYKGVIAAHEIVSKSPAQRKK